MIIKTASLTPAALKIIRDEGTERAFEGEYTDLEAAGTYLCRLCGVALFRSNTKFHSSCGWPSFDEAYLQAVKEVRDADGRRTEIVCARCAAHLGHVFVGESFTPKNVRHCVNSLSLDYVTNLVVTDTEEAIFAAGCFWGVEFYFAKLSGVLKTEVGYIGGKTEYPTYEAICAGDTGHIEAIRIIYDPHQISYEDLVKYFFEIHDPTQKNGQGPDIGEQYLSKIFYFNIEQKNAAFKAIDYLGDTGLLIATEVVPVKPFWRAESYHQAYYAKNQKQPYCHIYTKRFV